MGKLARHLKLELATYCALRRLTEPACQLVARILHRTREREALETNAKGSPLSTGPPFIMNHPYSYSIIEILRSTLSRLEKDSDFRQDDPAVVQLKRHVIQSLAEFESQKNTHPILEPEPALELEAPISVLRLR
jgi:hypothetical protein